MMARKFALNDESVVVVVGSGAGGGTLSNELAQKGIDVVCLEIRQIIKVPHDRPRLEQGVDKRRDS